MISGTPLSDDSYINNYKEGTVYVSQFAEGKYISRAYDDGTESGFDVQVSSRICIRVAYIGKKEDISAVDIIKLYNGKERERVRLTNFGLQKVHEFLQYITQTDLKELVDHRRPEHHFENITPDLLEGLKLLCEKEDSTDLFEALLKHECITSRDIVNTGYRKKGLKIFENLLEHPDFWVSYAADESISAHSEEKVFQHFFKRNEWIFGYGLDYRFMSILQDEAHLSSGDLDGSEDVIADYLMGDKFFTTFVELKKPTTSLFGQGRNRAGSWKLSNELFYAVSQILEQKAAGQINVGPGAYIDGEPLQQRAYDSKVILIIGHWRELQAMLSTKEKEIKKKTFELFRRDSRNIEILTYDELYERASFILDHSASQDISPLLNPLSTL